MNKGHIYFEIQADDPSRAVHFYSQVFDWKFEEVKGLPISYWRIETGGPRGGLLKRPVQAPPRGTGTNAFVCSVEVESFDSTAKTIAAPTCTNPCSSLHAGYLHLSTGCSKRKNTERSSCSGLKVAAAKKPVASMKIVITA